MRLSRHGFCCLLALGLGACSDAPEQAGEGIRPTPGFLRQGLTCGMATCGDGGFFCGENYLCGEPTTGFRYVCCECEQLFACGSDCLSCEEAGSSSTSCLAGGYDQPAAQSCVPTCLPGHQDLDGDGANGCEPCTVAAACGQTCLLCPTAANADPTCVDGVCSFTCQPGFADQDRDARDGCETRCNQPGLCGSDCQPCPARAHGQATCAGNTLPSGAACGFTCDTGYLEANGGCETCARGYHRDGSSGAPLCARCDTSRHCGWGCVDCAPGEACVAGACARSCATTEEGCPPGGDGKLQVKGWGCATATGSGWLLLAAPLLYLWGRGPGRRGAVAPSAKSGKPRRRASS